MWERVTLRYLHSLAVTNRNFIWNEFLNIFRSLWRRMNFLFKIEYQLCWIVMVRSKREIMMKLFKGNHQKPPQVTAQQRKFINVAVVRIFIYGKLSILERKREQRNPKTILSPEITFYISIYLFKSKYFP
jgi:hypothetical protein